MVGVDIAHCLSFKDVVTALHFLSRPLKRHDALLRICNNRGEEVGNTVIERKFDALRVHHDQPELVRAIAVEEGSDEGVDSN